MPAAGLAALQRVEREEFGEFEVVGHASGVLEALIQVVGGPRHRDGMPELVAQLRNRRQRPFEALLGARHPDVVPHDAPELAMDFADAAMALYAEELIDPLLDAVGGLP